MGWTLQVDTPKVCPAVPSIDTFPTHSFQRCLLPCFHSLTIYHFFLGGCASRVTLPNPEDVDQVEMCFLYQGFVLERCRPFFWNISHGCFGKGTLDWRWVVCGCSVPLEQVTCWGTFDDLASLCSGIDRDGVISNKRRCPPPLGQNIGEMAVLPVEMHPTCICCICPCFFLAGWKGDAGYQS